MLSKKGSFITEYALFIAIAAVALILMSIYIKRSLSGRWRDAGDSFGYGRQYDPAVTQEQR